MFEAYCVGSRFDLPRLILLDVDGKVVWEGGAGFRPNMPWQPGLPSYLDTPLQSLLERRKLREIAGWKKAWFPRGARAAAEGDFETAWPLLQQTADLPSEPFPDVARVADGARKIQDALASPDAFAQFAAPIAEAGRQPALAALLEWGKAMKRVVKPTTKTSALLHDDVVSAWNGAWRKAASTAKSAPAGKETETLRALAIELGALAGFFPKALAADLSAALDKNDLDAAKRVCAEAERRPARWLFAEAFGIAAK
jgi:hypothetical protein